MNPLILSLVFSFLLFVSITGVQSSYWQASEIGSWHANPQITNPAYWMDIGQKEMDSGNYAAAGDAYHSALVIKPDDPNLLNLLGLALLKEGRPEDAIPYISRAITIKPHAAPFYLNLGTAYANMTEYSSAVQYYQKAVELSPSYLSAWNNLCLASLRNDDPKGARDSCTRSLEIDRKNPDTWINLGEALLACGHYQEAEDVFVHALRYPLSPAGRKEAETGLVIAKTHTNRSEVPLYPIMTKAMDIASDGEEEIYPELIYPSIIPLPEPGEPTDFPVLFTFGYHGSLQSIHLSLSSSLLKGARAAYKAPIPNNATVAGTLQTRKRFYEAFINEPGHEPIIASIHEQLREIENRTGLHASYLELAVTFVRSLETDLSATEVRYPVELLADNAGDCDDRSVLLAALLGYHGYDLAIIEFPNHVAVGLRESGPVQGKNTYIPIETTQDLPLGNLTKEWDTHPGLLIPISRSGFRSE